MPRRNTPPERPRGRWLEDSAAPITTDQLALELVEAGVCSHLILDQGAPLRGRHPRKDRSPWPA